MNPIMHPALVGGLTPAERQSAEAAKLNTSPSNPVLSGATAQTGGFAQAGSDFSTSNIPALIGATALTSGFAQAGSDPHSFGNPVQPPTSGFGGPGLASSPNVPRPGTSIDPATGKPHTAGLTRAELEARKAQAAASGSTDDEAVRHLAELSGREQAARQLTGTASDVITPGLELPGGWGPAKQVPVPGSGPNAPTTIYEDIGYGLEKVGHAAYGLIPQGLKDAINPDLPLDKGKQPMGQPPKERPSSITNFLEAAKQTVEKGLHEVQDTFNNGNRPSSLKGERTNGAMGSDGSVIDQVKQFFAEAGSAAQDARLVGVVGPLPGVMAQRKPAGGETYIAPMAGAGVPGVISAGSTSLPSQENQGMLPGEVSKGVGALPGGSKEEGVALLPDEKAATGDEGGLVLTGAPVPTPQPSTSEPSQISQPSERTLPSTTALPTLAPPLPATHLGDGAAAGATDLDKAGLPADSSVEPNALDEKAPSTLSPSTAAVPTRDPNDRATSSASITAIRDGHEGHRPSPLAASAVPEEPSISNPKATPDGDNTVTPSAVTSNAKSLTPGEESAGVGHPSSRGEGTTREPGTYPAVDHDAPVAEQKHITPTSAVPAATSTNDTVASEKPATSAAVAPTSPAVAQSEKTPTTPTKPLNGVDKEGHHRTGSAGSSGKKKVGFMSKLKGEMKVLSGKMSHDEKKIQEGERMKHGE